jgi:chromosome segregation ATPase
MPFFCGHRRASRPPQLPMKNPDTDPQNPSLTAEQRLEVHKVVGDLVRYWTAFLGIASCVGLLASLVYVFFVLPGKAFEEAKTQYTKIIDEKANTLDARLRALDTKITDSQIKVASYDKDIETNSAALTAAIKKRTDFETQIAKVMAERAQEVDHLKIETAKLEAELSAAQTNLKSLKVSKEESQEIVAFLEKLRAGNNDFQRLFLIYRDQIAALIVDVENRQEREQKLGALRAEQQKYTDLLARKGLDSDQKKKYRAKVEKLGAQIKTLEDENKSDDDDLVRG